MWVVPVYNPDGLARNSRRNAHGVDLNRNYPYDWVDLDGNYESGPKPASEPETRAMMRFLRKIRPDYILSFHQPLNGVDINVERPKFARKVARHLHLPTTNLDCGGVCHGTMTGWFNHHFTGFALTVEYGATPGRARMRKVAPPQVLAIFDAFRARGARPGSYPAGPYHLVRRAACARSVRAPRSAPATRGGAPRAIVRRGPGPKLAGVFNAL